MARFLLRYKLKAISLAAAEPELTTGDIVLLSGALLLFFQRVAWPSHAPMPEPGRSLAVLERALHAA